MEPHRLIWQQANNARLCRLLASMVGPIFMCVGSNADHQDWAETLKLHHELVACIGTGDVAGAIASIEQHMNTALKGALRTFQEPNGVATVPA